MVRPKACIDVSGDYTDPSHCSDGTFTCGDRACDKYVEICVLSANAVGPPTAECRATPAACAYGVADCGCVAETVGTCTTVDDQVTINLPAL